MSTVKIETELGIPVIVSEGRRLSVGLGGLKSYDIDVCVFMQGDSLHVVVSPEAFDVSDLMAAAPAGGGFRVLLKQRGGGVKPKPEPETLVEKVNGMSKDIEDRDKPKEGLKPDARMADLPLRVRTPEEVERLWSNQAGEQYKLLGRVVLRATTTKAAVTRLQRAYDERGIAGQFDIKRRFGEVVGGVVWEVEFTREAVDDCDVVEEYLLRGLPFRETLRQQLASELRSALLHVEWVSGPTFEKIKE